MNKLVELATKRTPMDADSTSGFADGAANRRTSTLGPNWLRAPAVVCLGIALVVTTALIAIGIAISSTYHARAPYHFDSASYRFSNVEVYEHYQSEGLAAVVLHQLRQPNSFDVVVRLLIYPRSLCHFHGHLYVQAPLMVLFFFVTLWYVHRVCGSYRYGICVVAIAFFFGPVFHPVQSIFDYWKESLAIWMLGAAFMAWLLSEHGRLRGWSFLSGLMLGLLVWQRPVLGIYGVALFLPFLMAGVYRRWREDAWPVFLANAAAFGLAPMAIGMSVVILQSQALHSYYFVTGYSYANPWIVLMWLIDHPYSRDWGTLIGLPACLAVGLLAGWGNWRQRIGPMLGALWLILGFVGLIMATRALYHAYAYVLLVLTVVGLALLAPRHLSPLALRRVSLGLGLVVGSVTAAQAWLYLPQNRQLARHRAHYRFIYDQIGDAVAESPPDSAVGIFFSECHLVFWNQLYFDRGIRLHQTPIFTSIHDSYYRAKFGDRPPEEIAATIISEMERKPQCVAVSFKNPDVLTKNLREAGRSVAMPVLLQINEHLLNSAQWREVQCVRSTRFPAIVIHRFEPHGSPTETAVGRSPPSDQHQAARR